MSEKGVYYSDYLQLDKLLDAQTMRSIEEGKEAHDEMLFIIIHQSYELWFKQILFEMESIIGIFSKEEINDNDPDLQVAVHRIHRVITILNVLVKQIDIIETMTPLDFLDFRNLLRPASGFQSVQFKIIEASLGLKTKDRFGLNYFITQLREEDIRLVKSLENGSSLIELVNRWLERMPFFQKDGIWKEIEFEGETSTGQHSFWDLYASLYQSSLVTGEKGNLDHFNKVLFRQEQDDERKLSATACRNALFIMLYRDYPLLHLPFRLLNALLDIDEQLASWRYRHVIMVQRMIGTRVGTGGSSGRDYLKSAADKHYIFKEVAELTTFLVERVRLPKLPSKLVAQLGFEYESIQSEGEV